MKKFASPNCINPSDLQTIDEGGVKTRRWLDGKQEA